MLVSSPVVKRSLVAAIISVLAVGLILVVLIALPPGAARSVADVIEYEDKAQLQVDARLRGAEFTFVDHELQYAGAYGLSPAAAVEKGADFAFVDHELAYAGGYGLEPAATAARGADFDFADHELRYAGGYDLQSPALAAERAHSGRRR